MVLAYLAENTVTMILGKTTQKSGFMQQAIMYHKKLVSTNCMSSEQALFHYGGVTMIVCQSYFQRKRQFKGLKLEIYKNFIQEPQNLCRRVAVYPSLP